MDGPVSPNPEMDFRWDDPNSWINVNVISRNSLREIQDQNYKYGNIIIKNLNRI